jgi:aryl-alcohol dehydrogenase-like predicted oxidoreductase
MAKVGSRRERSYRACKIRVSTSSSSSHLKLSHEALVRYEHGVNTFDTSNNYSNGLSEVCLGKAIKTLNLPREEIVVMTKVCGQQYRRPGSANAFSKVHGAVGKVGNGPLWITKAAELDKMGYVNQHGLSRKVHIFTSLCMSYLLIPYRRISLAR